MSWHPGARSSQRFSHNVYGGEQALGNTIDGLEHLAVSSNGPPVIDTSAPVHCSPLETPNMYGMPSSFFDQPMYTMSDATAMDYNLETSSAYPNTQLYSSSSLFNTDTIPSYVPSDYATTFPVYKSNGTFTQAAVAPIINLEDPSYQQAPQPRPQPRSPAPTARVKKSRELVGMGLYDDTAKVQRESIGKTLKLEDSWQPSEKTKEVNDIGVEDDHDEEYSTDEEDEEPAPLPGSSDLPNEVPVFQDLSNQSFFFENDDSYGNLMATGSDVPFYQPKVPEPVQATFSWI